jgi:hypothetical protein
VDEKFRDAKFHCNFATFCKQFVKYSIYPTERNEKICLQIKICSCRCKRLSTVQDSWKGMMRSAKYSIDKYRNRIDRPLSNWSKDRQIKTLQVRLHGSLKKGARSENSIGNFRSRKDRPIYLK